jgi:VCBS repeat protein
MRHSLTFAFLHAFLVVACFEAAPARVERFPVGAGPGVVVIMDANRDGKADVVTANERGGSVSVLLGDGRGHFSTAPGSPVAAGHLPNDVTAGDFNRDGWPDLAVANHETQQLTLLLGNGRGGFAPAPGSPVSVAVKPHPHGVAAGDFDGDGSIDLVTDSWGEDRLEILFNDGKGRFRAPGRYVPVGKHPYQRIRVGDLNGDGNADIVSPNLDGNNVTILLGDGKGTFAQPPGSPFPCGDSPFNVAVGDVNADGRADLAIVNSPSSTSDGSGRDGLTVLLGDGRGRFRPMPGTPFPMDRFPNLVAIGDIDGDKTGDIAVSNPDGDRITIFIMDRKGALASRREVAVRGHPKGLVIHDFDGDGKGDLVVANNADDTVTVIFGR